MAAVAQAERAEVFARLLEPVHPRNTTPEVWWIEAQTVLTVGQHDVEITRKDPGDAVLGIGKRYMLGSSESSQSIRRVSSPGRQRHV